MLTEQATPRFSRLGGSIFYFSTLVLVKTFESIHSASIETKINERSISAVCNNRKKSAGGFIWKIIS